MCKRTDMCENYSRHADCKINKKHFQNSHWVNPLSLQNGYPIFYHILPNLLEIVSLKKGQRLPQLWCCPASPGAVAYAAPLCAQSYPNISQPSSTDPKIKLHLTRWERFKVEFLFHPGPPNTRIGMSMSRLIRGSCIVNWEILQKFPSL